MSDQTPWPLIAKYLAGECSADEKLAMEWWLEEEKNAILFDEIKKSWIRQSQENVQFDTEKGLSILHDKLNLPEELTAPGEPNQRDYFKLGSWLSAACVILMMGLGYYLINKNLIREKIAAISYNQKSTGRDEVVSFVLPDGSKVWLNKNSKIEFPDKFAGAEREVFLEGEAFFEVVPNPAKPFIVKSNKLSTRVLGTSFNVKAYKNDETATVSVATGKVEVSKEIQGSRPVRITQLTPKQELVVNTKKDETYIDIVSTFDMASWRHEQLVFRNNTYKEVIQRLEADYNIHVELENKSLNDCRVMASFNKGAGLEDILKLLSISNSFSYKINENEITILGGSCR